jgi:hypothetical protein
MRRQKNARMFQITLLKAINRTMKKGRICDEIDIDMDREEKEIENEEDLDELEIQKKIAELYLELLQQRKKKKVKTHSTLINQ